MRSFKDQVVWITGASSGIGEALAYVMSAQGAKLILSSRRIAELERVKNNCAHPDHVHVLPLDLTTSTGAIIGSGVVVTNNVADYTIVAGNPAKVISRRITEEVEMALKRIAWWDWDRDSLIKAIPDFRRLNACDFALKYDPK